MSNEMQKIEYDRRQNIVKQMRSIIEANAMKTGTDPVLNVKTTRDEFKRTLKDMDLPFTLMVVRAMIEGAIFVQTAQKMGSQIYPAELSIGLLYVFEDEMQKEKAETLKALNNI